MINHSGTQTIETERLILRKHELSDAEDIFRNWASDPAVSRFWGWTPHENIEETKALLKGWIEEYKNPAIYHWIIVYKNAAQAVGYIYLNEFDGGDGASVHFALSRKYWNQGIMTEACKGVLDFAFSKLRLKRISSRHHAENPASGRVMEKCGMKYIKTEYRRVPDCEEISGDYCYYEIKADDY